eukprot:528378_1
MSSLLAALTLTENLIAAFDQFKVHVINFSETTLDCQTFCKSKIRIAHSLKYYHSLQIENSASDQNKLLYFYNNIYNSVLSDFIHLITNHEHELEEINDYCINSPILGLAQCNINDCKVSSRHNRNREVINNNNNDLQFIFIRDLFDSIHCYIFHQYDYGFRIHKNNNNKTQMSPNEYEKDNIDNEFKHLTQIINDQTSASNSNNNVRFAKNNKYNIAVNPGESIASHSKDTSNHTFTDGFYQCINTSLLKFLALEEYDSDSIQQDITYSYNCQKSNILSLCLNEKHMQQVVQHVKTHKVSYNSFSTGLIFYYWEYYKVPETDEDKMEDIWGLNINDHGGHEKHELYVITKYNDIKIELLNNKIYSLNIYAYHTSLFKANQFIKEVFVKKLKSHDIDDELHYGIDAHIMLTLGHLLSVILYADWTSLCYEFSATFRKRNIYETLLSVKQRNSEYANWSRLLRETVQYWGRNGEFQYDDDDGQLIKPLEGPFFCGLSEVMELSEFNIRLCGPTSTSKKIEVATRFGGDNGMIMQLNNSGDYHSDQLCAFGIGWISNYSGEDEWLFIGGQQRIKIEGIRDIRAHKNYKRYFKPLFLFDCVVNGTGFHALNAPEISDQDYLTIQNLIKHSLEINKFRNKYPQYINKTFQCCVDNKSQIVLNLDEITSYLNQLKDIIIDEKKSESQLEPDCVCGDYMKCITEDKLYDGKGVVCDSCGKAVDYGAFVFHCSGEKNDVHPNGFDICEDCTEKMLSGGRIVIKDVIIKLFKNLHRIIIYSNLTHPCDLSAISLMMERAYSSGLITNNNFTININQCTLQKIYWSDAWWISGTFETGKFVFKQSIKSVELTSLIAFTQNCTQNNTKTNLK